MGTPNKNNLHDGDSHDHRIDSERSPSLGCGRVQSNEADTDGFQQIHRQNRKRRNEISDKDDASDPVITPKRRTTDYTNNSAKEKQNHYRAATTPTSSYFNTVHTINKQAQANPERKQIYESSNRKQFGKENFPPFLIMIKNDQYPSQDVVIIKDINHKCKLNLTYGRMSTSKTRKSYLLYCNTSAQFEFLLDKSNWPSKICNQDYTFETPKRIPSSYSVVIVMSNVPAQWDVNAFCDELKRQHKTIIKGERLYIRGAKPISKIRIDFSSNKELTEILRNKRMLLDDGNTAYPIEPYVAPPRILRCYICQEYEDHVAAHCPNKDKPICFKCGQQHPYDPACQNKINCVHCKGDHLAGNPSCPKKIESREKKKLQMKTSALPLTYPPEANITTRWNGNGAQHLFGSGHTNQKSLQNVPDDQNVVLGMLGTMNTNLQNLLAQQNDMNKYLKEQKEQTNCQAKEIIQINKTLHEVIGPLLKEITHIIYAQIGSQQKRQIDPSYNKLVDFLNQKELQQSRPYETQQNKVLLQQQRQQHPISNDKIPANEKTTITNAQNESEL